LPEQIERRPDRALPLYHGTTSRFVRCTPAGREFFRVRG
jgi:hypothetical protein